MSKKRQEDQIGDGPVQSDKFCKETGGTLIREASGDCFMNELAMCVFKESDVENGLR